MKYLVYTALAFVAFLLFVPKTGTTEIRNLPLLILILAFVLALILFRLFKNISLMAKTKKVLKESNIRPIKTKFCPWSSCFHGHYSITFAKENQKIQFVLLTRKRTYQRYHFESEKMIEFYRANRVAFKTGKYSATVSNLVEVKRVGKQKLAWDDTATVRYVLFDHLPAEITDTVKKENLGVGETICRQGIYVTDLNHLPDLIQQNYLSLIEASR